MPTSVSPLFTIFLFGVYLLVLALPGLLTGLAVGLRGWILAGFAPLFTYAIAGLAGPWLHALGLPFNVATFLVVTVLFAAAGFGLRKLALRRKGGIKGDLDRDGRDKNGLGLEKLTTLWTRHGHIAVLICLIFAVLLGGYTVLDGLGKIDAISQGFDSVYHANAIRYIADTGDGGLMGTSQTNWYADASGVFYPNAYHLVSAVGYQISGASIPAILNTNTVLLPGLLALSLVTTIREFRGRAVLAGATALVAIAPATMMYESMIRGPLLPFLLGLALTPLGTVALHRYLTRPAMDTGFIFAIAAVGLLTIHPSTLFASILFAFPLLVQRWATAISQGRARTLLRDLVALIVLGVSCVILSFLQLFGALGVTSSSIQYFGWPSEGPISSALGMLLTFQHFQPKPQFWLAGALFLGLIFFSRLRELRWIGGTAVLTGLFYLAVSSSNNSLVMAAARPWWDDPYRFLAMAVLPLCVIVGNGLAETQTWLRDRLAGRFDNLQSSSWLAPTLAIAVLGGFVGISGGLYHSSNAAIMAPGYANQPGVDKHKLPVSPDEAQAMLELGKRAKPGDWAMNDRLDGTTWTYALTGIRTVAGHYDQTAPPADALLLSDHFRDYATDPKVRAAVQRLNVRWVIVGQYGYPPEATRQKGLLDLDRKSFLKLVYRNADASVYQLIPEPGKL